MTWSPDKTIYSGPEFHYDLVGEMPVNNPLYLAELKRLQERAVERGYEINQKGPLPFLPFDDAVRISKRFQPWDPTNPEKDFARELRLALADELGLKEEELDRVKIYTAVGGPLDLHGVDFFITYTFEKEGKRQEICVYYDITKNPDKEFPSHGQADLLVKGVPDPSDKDYSEKKYLGIIGDYAQKSVEVLREKGL